MHYVQKIALQRLIDIFSKNDALQSRMFVCHSFVILMMNCVYCFMRYAISIMHNAPMHFFHLFKMHCLRFLLLKKMTPHTAKFVLVFNCMNYALCIMQLNSCIMHKK